MTFDPGGTPRSIVPVTLGSRGEREKKAEAATVSPVEWIRREGDSLAPPSDSNAPVSSLTQERSSRRSRCDGEGPGSAADVERRCFAWASESNRVAATTSLKKSTTGY